MIWRDVFFDECVQRKQKYPYHVWVHCTEGDNLKIAMVSTLSHSIEQLRLKQIHEYIFNIPRASVLFYGKMFSTRWIKAFSLPRCVNLTYKEITR